MSGLFYSFVLRQKNNFKNFRIIIGGLIQQIFINLPRINYYMQGNYEFDNTAKFREVL